MLTEIYIEALLVDEELADQVWEAWYAGEIDEQLTGIAWMLIVCSVDDQHLYDQRASRQEPFARFVLYFLQSMG